jgi:hypothetical protein
MIRRCNVASSVGPCVSQAYGAELSMNRELRSETNDPNDDCLQGISSARQSFHLWDGVEGATFSGIWKGDMKRGRLGSGSDI